MLKVVSVILVVVYFAVLFYTKFYQEPKSRKALLVIRSRVKPEGVEWALYSFRRFLRRNLPELEWWVYLEDGEDFYEKRKIIRSLSRRFEYKVQERYYVGRDFERIFFADLGGNFDNWQQEISHRTSKSDW